MSSSEFKPEEDSLVEVPTHFWPSLLIYFKGPKHLTARVTLKNQIHNKTQIRDYPVQIFAPYAEPHEGIVFIWPLVSKNFNMYLLFNVYVTVNISKH